MDYETLYQQVVKMINEENPKFNPLPAELKKAILELKSLGAIEQLKLLMKLEEITGLPEIGDLVRQFPYLDTLPPELLKEISTFVNNPEDIKALIATNKSAHTLFQTDRLSSKFLQQVAYGEQDKAEKLLTIIKETEKQELLGKEGRFTDYSGREFHCTAYEYAYWAKDKHMCRMLEKHMDDNTKAQMLKRCDEIEKNGLMYKQHGVEFKGSKHFDFTPLKEALKDYIDGYDNWKATSNWMAMGKAWMRVGIAQRELPAHVVNEYCRKDRSFDRPEFNEDTLPRELTFHNHITRACETWFPLRISGLGRNFSLGRGAAAEVRTGPGGLGGPTAAVILDLAAISCLDEVRTADLTQSRENLKPVDPMHKHSK